MQIVLPILYTLLFIWIIFKWKFFYIPQLSRKKIALLFIIKIIIGIIMWLADKYYYNFSDAFQYYYEAEILHNYFSSNPGDVVKFILGIDNPSTAEISNAISTWNASFENTLLNDSRTMTRINFLLRFISFGSFHVHIVIMCFASFIGLTALYKSLQSFFINKNFWLIIAIYFIPTVLYWSSGVLKEAVLIMGIGLLLYSTAWGTSFLKDRKNTFLLLFSLLCLLSVKIYVLFLILIPLIANYFYAKAKKQKLWFSYGLICLFSIFILGLIALTKPDYNVLKIIKDKQAKAISESIGGCFLGNKEKFICIDYNDYKYNNRVEKINKYTYKIKQGSKYLEWKQNNMSDTTYITNSTDTSSFRLFYVIIPPKSRLDIPKMDGSIISFIKNIPFALFHTLIRPCLIKPKSFFEWFSLAENYIVLLFILLSIIFYQKPIGQQKTIIAFCFFTSLCLLILIGLTTPTPGSMVRYKLPVLLFLAIAIFMLIDFKRIQFLFKKK